MKIETLKDFVQSANINFLFGSGLSRPYLSTLGKIEDQLSEVDSLHQEKREAVKATLYRQYFKTVIEPNCYIGSVESYVETLSNYKNFLKIWNVLLQSRYSSLISKQINIFTTNIDRFVEVAAEAAEVEFNDGFSGSVKPVFSETNFQKSVRKESVHFRNSAELPVFNLFKMHGSINWKNADGRIFNDFNLDLVTEVSRTLEGYGVSAFPKYDEDILNIESNVGKNPCDYSDFLSAYEKFLIVNPTKHKFSETVLDVHFYELMRIFSNNLEKENTILFVMGFSFADEHIRNIVKRALRTNPTLMVIIFAYNDEAEESFRSYFQNSASNLRIITPESFKQANKMVSKDTFSEFDFKNINRVFRQIQDIIPTGLKDVK